MQVEGICSDMKEVKCVQWLVMKALKTDKAHVRRKKVTVYEAEIFKGNLELRHYGTLILVVDLLTKRIMHLGGWSRTDRDCINNALHMLDIDAKVRLVDGSIELIKISGDRKSVV